MLALSFRLLVSIFVFVALVAFMEAIKPVNEFGTVYAQRNPEARQGSLVRDCCATRVKTESQIADAPRVAFSANTGSAWLTNSNWTGNAVPGGAQIAQFGVAPTSGSVGVGINANDQTNNGAGNQIVGAIEVASTRDKNLIIGNSSRTIDGKLTLAGATVNGVPNVVIRNASSKVLEIRNLQGSNGNSSNKLLDLVLGNPINNVILIDGAGGINIISEIQGIGANLTLLANGFDPTNDAILTLSAANTYSGETIIQKGSLALIDDGSIAYSPVIEIGTDGYFDVQSTTNPYILADGQSLRFSGQTGTGFIVVGGKGLSTSATSNLYFSNFSPPNSPVTVSGSGGLLLQTTNQVIVSVNNGGVPLPVGQYRLIAKTNGGSVSGLPASLSVVGDGIASGTFAALEISNGELFLRVFGPSAGPASISGRVVTADGRGIANQVVMVMGGDLAEPRSVRTNTFGFYRFEGLPSGQTYFLSVLSGKLTFFEPTRYVDLASDLNGLDFVAIP